MINIKRLLLLILFLIQVSITISQDWKLDLNEAQNIAKNNNRKIILVFSGSDWCAPCIKLEKEIWNSEYFQNYAKENYVMLRADFPRKKANKLSAEQTEKNNQLAEKYNQKGFFPLVVVLNKDLKVLGETGYKKMTPKEYIEHLNSIK